MTTHSLRKHLIAIGLPAVFSLTVALSSVSAQDTVSRAEYDKLKREHEAMKQEMAEMKTQMREVLQQRSTSGRKVAKEAPSKATDERLSESMAEVGTLKEKVKDVIPGDTKFLLGGYGSATLTTHEGHGGAFDATFNPIFLWKLSDRLLFEGELELELEHGGTSTALEMAQVSYVLNDYMTIGAGKFLNPTNYFVERQHMAWVNKLPDKPLAVYDGLMPETEVGVQVRGVIPLGTTQLEYAVFVANAPAVKVVPDDPADRSTVGTLDFENYDNQGGHVAVGGHVGFLPIPQLEIGYGIQRSNDRRSSHDINVLLQSVDLNYVRDSDILKGLLALRAQWVWSDVGSFTYDANGTDGFGPLNFSNHRNGGYVQASYRPSHAESFVKDLEPVIRYDVLNQKKTPVGYDEQRLTIGLNYWLNATTVIKAAYEFDHKNGGGERDNVFMLQMATGF